MQWNEFSFTSVVVFEYDSCIVPKPVGMTARSKVRPVDLALQLSVMKHSLVEAGL